jgi:hypothetical protein
LNNNNRGDVGGEWESTSFTHNHTDRKPLIQASRFYTQFEIDIHPPVKKKKKKNLATPPKGVGRKVSLIKRYKNSVPHNTYLYTKR